MHYLDTSLIVAALTIESRSSQALRWLEERQTQRLLVSDWTVVEVASALALKLRTGQIKASEKAGAEAAFNRIVRDSLEKIAVEGVHYRRASMIVGNADLKLRAGDALHLAIAEFAGAHIATLDGRMAEAGSSIGIPATLVA